MYIYVYIYIIYIYMLYIYIYIYIYIYNLYLIHILFILIHNPIENKQFKECIDGFLEFILIHF